MNPVNNLIEINHVESFKNNCEGVSGLPLGLLFRNEALLL